MKKLLVLISAIVILSNFFIYAQLTVKDQEATPNTLLLVNDEGTSGSITLPPLSSIGTSANKLYNIGNSLFWNGIALGTSGSAAGWTDLGSNVILSSPSDKVGIGTSTPTAALHVNGDDGVLFEGTFASGTIPKQGAGTRMMWYPKKAAFRVGRELSDNWDEPNIGIGSFVAGTGKASAEYSTALGNSLALGDYSFSVGQGQAQGSLSSAFGYSSVALGEISFSSGYGISADSYLSTVFGSWNLGGGSADSWIETDPLFEIGNGNVFESSNALTVLKNGNVGIGIHNPSNKLDISGGNFLVRGNDGFTAPGHTGTIHLGSVHHYIQGEYGFGLKIGTYVAGDVISIKEVSGDVGIGTTNPDAKLEVNGDVKIGTNGIKFSEIIELTGTTGTSRTEISYPTGYNKTNTRIISYQVEDNLLPPGIWVSGWDGLWVGLEETIIKLGHEASSFNGQPYRLMLMKVE